jgi:5-methyltetrahydrofolate--homocysteine methyltransferase
MKTNSIRQQLKDLLAKQILILDGAFGTEIKKLVSTDRPYEFLNIDNPDSVKQVHVSYIKAGANIITTNSFGGSSIELKDFCSEDEALKLCSRAAIIAKGAAQQFTQKVFVAGSVGPTSHSLMFQDDVSFDELLLSFKGQIKALILGGVDIILFETFFDILNVRAATQAYLEALDELTISTEEIPLKVSITLTEQGRILTGHSIKDVWNSIKHADPISFGLNCGFGIDKAVSFIGQYDELPVFVSMHSNAGLPDDNGNYSIDSDRFAFEASKVKDKVNILGGCCGTTPKHIACLCNIHHSDCYD